MAAGCHSLLRIYGCLWPLTNRSDSGLVRHESMPSALLRLSVFSCLQRKYSVSPHISDTHMSFSPPPANTSGGYTLIWLDSKFIFIVLHLPKIQEEEYKAYSLALSLCFSTHDRANAQDFIQHLTSSKQWVHHRCSLASIRQLEELVSHHWESSILDKDCDGCEHLQTHASHLPHCHRLQPQ